MKTEWTSRKVTLLLKLMNEEYSLKTKPKLNPDFPSFVKQYTKRRDLVGCLLGKFKKKNTKLGSNLESVIPKNYFADDNFLKGMAIGTVEGGGDGKDIAKIKELNNQSVFDFMIPFYPGLIISTPSCFQTPEMVEIAVKRDPDTLQHIPQLITYKVALMIIDSCYDIFKLIPNTVQDLKLVVLAVELDERNFQHVRSDLQNETLALMAVIKSVENLQFVRKDLQTPELALVAVRGCGSNLKYVPAHCQTKEIALMAVKDDGSNLKYVPAHLQTKEVIDEALKHTPSAKRYIKTKDMIKNALEEVLGEED